MSAERPDGWPAGAAAALALLASPAVADEATDTLPETELLEFLGSPEGSDDLWLVFGDELPEADADADRDAIRDPDAASTEDDDES